MGKIIHYKTDEEIELIRKNCLIVSEALAHVASILKPGITSFDIDAAAEEVIRDHGAVPGFKGYGGFPGTLCISYNDIVVHGIPNEYEFQDGDIVSVDCGSVSEGYNGDAAYTFAIGNVSEDVIHLLETTRASLYKGIEQAVVGNRIGDISSSIQELAEKQNGYGIVRELVGHGVGKQLHEAPEIPNYGKRGKGIKLQHGLVIAIEPMVNLGKRDIYQAEDGWTIRTRDGLASAHFEHTVAVKDTGVDILSSHKKIEENIKNNENLRFF